MATTITEAIRIIALTNQSSAGLKNQKNMSVRQKSAGCHKSAGFWVTEQTLKLKKWKSETENYPTIPFKDFWNRVIAIRILQFYTFVFCFVKNTKV